MKMNIPWKVLNMVKRYAITMDASLMKKRPKDHVRPSRHSSAKAPMTQDLEGRSTDTLRREDTHLAPETLRGQKGPNLEN